MSDDIAYMSAGELTMRFNNRSLSPVEAVDVVLKRIDRFDGKINAFCFIDEKSARAEARKSEDRWIRRVPNGLLDGVPTSIKDLNLARGWPTGRGSLTSKGDDVADEDAPAVARLREAGANLIGKTTSPEFGWKGVTDSPLTGITRNPWNLEKTPGGSSGGASAALAAGMGALAQGGDGGGSIRIPCGFTGIPGLKPSFGRVPVYPPSPFGTLSHVGPMARTVTDLALMLTAMSKPDPRDWQALPHLDKAWHNGVSESIRGLRVAFSPDLGYAEVDDEVADVVSTAVTAFTELGAKVEKCDPGFADPTPVFRVIWWAGAAYLVSTMAEEKRELLEPAFLALAEEGAEISMFELSAANAARAKLGQIMNLFHEQFDLLLTPTLAVPAFDAGQLAPEGDDDPLRWLRWTPFSYPFNMTGQPAATVPCGFTSEGLPVGLQIVGPKFRDDMVLRAARAFERVRPQNLRPDLGK